MKTKLFAGTLLATTMALGISQAVMAGGPPAHAGGGGGSDPGTCNLTETHSISHACRSELNSVKWAIENSDDSLSDRDRARMTGKVCEADEKLHQTAKEDDALLKLSNIDTKVAGLLSDRKTKINPDDAAAITAATYAAAECINAERGTF